MRRFLSSILSPYCTILLAENGQVALDMAVKHLPNLIVSGEPCSFFTFQAQAHFSHLPSPPDMMMPGELAEEGVVVHIYISRLTSLLSSTRRRWASLCASSFVGRGRSHSSPVSSEDYLLLHHPRSQVCFASTALSPRELERKTRSVPSVLILQRRDVADRWRALFFCRSTVYCLELKVLDVFLPRSKKKHSLITSSSPQTTSRSRSPLANSVRPSSR